jgi:hypothetical protein
VKRLMSRWTMPACRRSAKPRIVCKRLIACEALAVSSFAGEERGAAALEERGLERRALDAREEGREAAERLLT